LEGLKGSLSEKYKLEDEKKKLIIKLAAIHSLWLTKDKYRRSFETARDYHSCLSYTCMLVTPTVWAWF